MFITSFLFRGRLGSCLCVVCFFHQGCAGFHVLVRRQTIVLIRPPMRMSLFFFNLDKW